MGKAYPLGQCLEISQAFSKALSELDATAFQQERLLSAYRALPQFSNADGELRQVWGDLRGQYFQNAFLLGSRYLDVANDTVNACKPPVETLPLEQSGLSPIRDFFHFAELASRYWQAIVLPNVLIPSLAPYFPMIVLQPNTGPQRHGLFDYMIALTERGAFVPREAALTQLTFPEEWFALLRSHSDFGQNLPRTLSECRAESLNTCSMVREPSLYLDNTASNQAVRQALQVNTVCQRLRILRTS